MAKSGAVKIGTDKMRAPRAHMTGVVFTEGANKAVELPFVIGVMSDLAGKPKQAPPPVSQREFLEMDSGNLNAHMTKMKPRAAFQVPNVMSAEGGAMSVDLEFQSMDDFKPDAVAARFEPLRKLLEERENLKYLMNYLNGNPDAEAVVEDLLRKLEALQEGQQKS